MTHPAKKERTPTPLNQRPIKEAAQWAERNAIYPESAALTAFEDAATSKYAKRAASAALTAEVERLKAQLKEPLGACTASASLPGVVITQEPSVPESFDQGMQEIERGEATPMFRKDALDDFNALADALSGEPQIKKLQADLARLRADKEAADGLLREVIQPLAFYIYGEQIDEESAWMTRLFSETNPETEPLAYSKDLKAKMVLLERIEAYLTPPPTAQKPQEEPHP